jgi:DNA-binding NarL/FixJ family response regulator
MNSQGDFRAETLPSRGKVLIAGDHALVRSGIKMLVKGALGEMQFIEVGDGDALWAALMAHPRLRLAVIDLQMPKMFGGKCLADVARLHPEVPLIVLSSIGSPELMRQMMSIPTVYALLLKSASAANVQAAIQAALTCKKITCAPEMSAARPVDGLTPRQEQIRTLVRRGMSNKMIAAELGISEGTVKNHISEIFRVLKASNRTQVAQTEVAVDWTLPNSREMTDTMYDIEEYLHLAVHASANRNPHACLGYLKEALALEPDNAKAMYLLALEHAQIGLIERGISGLKKALARDPKLEIARLQLGILMIDHRPVEAREQFSISRGSADQALRTFAEGMIHAIDGQLAEALEKMQAGLGMQGKNLALRPLMQEVLSRLEKMNAAAAKSAPNAESTDDNRLLMGAYGSMTPPS